MNLTAKLTRRAALSGMATLAATAGATVPLAAAVPEVPSAPNMPPAATPDSYLYEIGTCVSHVDQPMPSLVMCRSKTGRGMELYGVRSFAYEDPNRDRLILEPARKRVE